MPAKLRGALLGYGAMGRIHAACYAKQKNVELTAVCDTDPDVFTQDEGKTGLAGVAKYRSFNELMRRGGFDLLDICIPTHLHAEYAVRAMKEGSHVLCETPMARTAAQADRMIRIARETDRKLMTAQCLRFAPNFAKLRKYIESGEFGRLLRLDLRRHSALPAKKWALDPAKSGSALLELHLQDTDCINWLFGLPVSVRTYGIVRDTGGIDDLLTAYQYKRNGPAVTAEASWCRGKQLCTVTAVFQQATAELTDFDRMTVCRPGQEDEAIRFERNSDPYFNEIAYFAECIVKNRVPEQCMVQSTRDSLRIAAAEERSARARRSIRLD